MRHVRRGTLIITCALALIVGVLVGLLDLDFVYALLVLFGAVASLGVTGLFVELSQRWQPQVHVKTYKRQVTVAEELAKLRELRDSGKLTDEEFDSLVDLHRRRLAE